MLGVAPRYYAPGWGAPIALHGSVRTDRQRTPTYLIADARANSRLTIKMVFEVVGHAPAREDALSTAT
jgi:hypothetical protein